MSGNGTSWVRAVSAFDRNAYLLFITAGLLGFTYWGITYLLTNLFVLRLGYGTVVVGLIAMGIAVLPLAIVKSWQPAAVGWAGMTAANSLNEAAMQVFILDIVAPRYRALMSGAANMASTLGLAASALWGGYLIRSAGFRAVFLLSAGLLFVSATCFGGLLGLQRRAQRAREVVPAQ